MTEHKQKVNNFLVLDLFPFRFVQDYLLVEGFSRTPSSFDVLKLVGVVYRHTQVCIRTVLDRNKLNKSKTGLVRMTNFLVLA